MFFSPQITGLKKKSNVCTHVYYHFHPLQFIVSFYVRTFQFGRRNPRERKKRKLLTLPNLMIKIKTDQTCFCNTVLTNYPPCELILRYWSNEYEFPNIQWVFISGQLVVKLLFSFFLNILSTKKFILLCKAENKILLIFHTCKLSMKHVFVLR